MQTLPSGIKSVEASDNAALENFNRNDALLDEKLQEYDAALAPGINSTVRDHVAFFLETDTRTTVFEYTAGVLTAIVEKDGATEVSRTTLNYNAGSLASVAETAGGKTVTTTLNRDGAGNLTDMPKGVA